MEPVLFIIFLASVAAFKPVVLLPDNESNPLPPLPAIPSPPSPPSSGTKSTYGSTASSISSASASASSTSSTAFSSSSSYATASTNGNNGQGPNRDCTYRRCTTTCSLPAPQDCPENSNPCKCPPGTTVSEKGGKCVPFQECQKYINCKGDYNASYTDCPIASPSTCSKPDAEYLDTKCGIWGCACKPGYLLTKKNGRCIKAEDCPGGNACGTNQTFVYCSVKCPNNYCPSDDSRAIIACDPPYPCPSGCSCQANYRIKSETENICIKASDCPPVNCTRPNEEWNPCPRPCFSDTCRSRNTQIPPEECPVYAQYCDPQCVCKEGFFRNDNEICVAPDQCPSDN